jgi:RHS repeat-associated protein
VAISILLLTHQIVECQPVTPPASFAGTTLVNYVRTWEAKSPEQNAATLITKSVSDVTQSTEYSDDFGRPIQTVIKKASFLGNDLVAPIVYDSYGRQQYRYLSFASSSAVAGDEGNIKADAFQQQVAFFNNLLNGQSGETLQGVNQLNWAYSKTNFEASPINRITSSYSPGANWVGSETSGSPHLTSVKQLANTALDAVRIWNILPTAGSIPTSTSVYAAGTLSKTITTDEQQKQTVVFKDLYGQTILKKVQVSASSDNGLGSGHAGWSCTYYVYDDFGNNRFIITPGVVDQINTWVMTQALADDLCYRMEYDQLNRLVIKKSPGSAEIWSVYDKWNRIVLKQDGNQRSLIPSQWTYTKYDALDRPAIAGIYSNATYTTQATMQAYLSAQNMARYETFQIATYPLYSLTGTFPSVALASVLNFTYYDGYTWSGWYGAYATKDNSFDSNFQTPSNSVYPYPQPLTQSTQTIGLQTGYWDAYDLDASYYDNYGRIIQTKNYNLTTGVDILTTQYAFSGKPMQSYLRQQVAGSSGAQTHTVSTKWDYDPMLRLLHVYKKVDGAASDQTISALTYDELGRLQKKSLGSNMENLNYDYNVRGWLLGVNRGYIGGTQSNFFGFELGYDKSATLATGTSFASQVYNGNISGDIWKSAGDAVNRKFDYVYDNLNQLASAPYLQNTAGTAWDKSYVDFSVNTISIDKNGNIGAMSQNGFLLGTLNANIDNLTYNYANGPGNSNRLNNVTDGRNDPLSALGDFHYASGKPVGNTDYTYDNNGNITSDYNRGISSITYNYLNLPLVITITNKGTITYLYDAVGNKLQKTVTDITVAGKTITTTTNYIGAFVYKTRTTTPTADPADYVNTLQFISHEEGRVRYFPLNGSSPAHFNYDYFIKDHLDNTRMVITDELQQDIYVPATLENTTKNGRTPLSFESNYYTINSGDIISTSTLGSWYTSLTGSGYQNQNNGGTPINNDIYSTPTATSTQVYRLNGQTGDKYGLGITLKVMAGDKISIFANSFWHNTSQTLSPYPITGALSGFIGAFAGTPAVISGGHGLATSSTLNGLTATMTPLTSLLNSTAQQPSPTTQPKAAINWILFDDQFRPVSSSTGTDLVDPTGASVKNHSKLNIPMAKNGYLYVYCSNESDIDVYFDNLQVVHTRGPILEETHYYPSGLAMAGISDHAWNKAPNYFHYQGNELQSQEFNDGSGLEEYDFKARYYDQQLGVWHNQDPANQFSSPYAAMGNNWPNGRDRNGQWFGIDDIIVSAVGLIAGYVGYGLLTHNWGGKAILSGVAGAAIAEGGYLTLGGGLAETGLAGAGGAGAVSSASTFASSYAFSTATSLFTNRGQISQASGWGAFGLIAGYSFFSSVNAGFSSNSIEDAYGYTASSSGSKIDAFMNSASKYANSAAPDLENTGAWGGAVGGFLSTLGSGILQSYNPTTKQWNLKSTLGTTLGGAIFDGGFGGYLEIGMAGGLSADDPEIYDFPNSSALLDFFTEKTPTIAGGLLSFANSKFWQWLFPGLR